MFNNYLWIYHRDIGSPFSAIGYKFKASAEGHEICRNIVVTAKENSANLYRLSTTKRNADDSITGNIGVIYGDKYCNNEDKPCMHNLTLDKIAGLCNICDGIYCDIYISWK